LEQVDCKPVSSLDPLVSLIKALRGENGCPWDKKQTAQSLSVYLIEETYELVEAITIGDAAAIREELGDVLFHILFIAQLFQETGKFNIGDVIRENHDKMVRRHPHVFGEGYLRTAEEVKKQWREIKKKEKTFSPTSSVLDSIPASLPVLLRAYRISERAAGNGFDWGNLRDVVAKAEEEWREFRFELDKNVLDENNRGDVMMEFGDLLFTLVNVARFAKIHPETALSNAILKFKERFTYMERAITAGNRELLEVTQQEKDLLWEEAKKHTAPSILRG
jgi:tetrapyrrole methylase family protein / MazG family protein